MPSSRLLFKSICRPEGQSSRVIARYSPTICSPSAVQVCTDKSFISSDLNEGTACLVWTQGYDLAFSNSLELNPWSSHPQRSRGYRSLPHLSIFPRLENRFKSTLTASGLPPFLSRATGNHFFLIPNKTSVLHIPKRAKHQPFN